MMSKSKYTPLGEVEFSGLLLKDLGTYFYWLFKNAPFLLSNKSVRSRLNQGLFFAIFYILIIEIITRNTPEPETNFAGWMHFLAMMACPIMIILTWGKSIIFGELRSFNGVFKALFLLILSQVCVTWLVMQIMPTLEVRYDKMPYVVGIIGPCMVVAPYIFIGRVLKSFIGFQGTYQEAMDE